MIGIRYEYKNRGLFRAMDLFDDVMLSRKEELDLYDAKDVFDEELSIPDVCTVLGKVRCYFTESGNDHFQEELKTFSHYLEQYFGGKATIIKEDVPLNEIIYEDNYQFVRKIA